MTNLKHFTTKITKANVKKKPKQKISNIKATELFFAYFKWT